jgi:hypothetical protein
VVLIPQADAAKLEDNAYPVPEGIRPTEENMTPSREAMMING